MQQQRSFNEASPWFPSAKSREVNARATKIILDKYGLNDPIPVQYVRYLGNLAKGDLGVSFQYDNRPVSTLIADRIGPSAQLGFQALVFGTIVGILLGVIAAVRHNTAIDYGATVLAVLGISIPSFVFGGLLQYYIGVKLKLLPVAFGKDLSIPLCRR